MEWFSCKEFSTEHQDSPVTADQLVCVRFFGEDREDALSRGFYKNCDEMVWTQFHFMGNGRIIEYTIKD